MTNTVAWQTSFLRDHCLPSDSPYLGAGNVTADQVGLFWFTSKEQRR